MEYRCPKCGGEALQAFCSLWLQMSSRGVAYPNDGNSPLYEMAAPEGAAVRCQTCPATGKLEDFEVETE